MRKKCLQLWQGPHTSQRIQEFIFLRGVAFLMHWLIFCLEFTFFLIWRHCCFKLLKDSCIMNLAWWLSASFFIGLYKLLQPNCRVWWFKRTLKVFSVALSGFKQMCPTGLTSHTELLYLSQHALNYLNGVNDSLGYPFDFLKVIRHISSRWKGTELPFELGYMRDISI